MIIIAANPSFKFFQSWICPKFWTAFLKLSKIQFASTVEYSSETSVQGIYKNFSNFYIINEFLCRNSFLQQQLLLLLRNDRQLVLQYFISQQFLESICKISHLYLFKNFQQLEVTYLNIFYIWLLQFGVRYRNSSRFSSQIECNYFIICFNPIQIEFKLIICQFFKFHNIIMRKYQDVINSIINTKRSDKQNSLENVRMKSSVNENYESLLKTVEQLRKINFLLQQQKAGLELQVKQLQKQYKKQLKENKLNQQKNKNYQKEIQELRFKLKRQQIINQKIQKRLYSLNTTKRSSKSQTEKSEHQKTQQNFKSLQAVNLEVSKQKSIVKTLKNIYTQTQNLKQVTQVGVQANFQTKSKKQNKNYSQNIKRLENIIEKQKELIQNYQNELSQTTRLTGRIVKSKSFVGRRKILDFH